MDLALINIFPLYGVSTNDAFTPCISKNVLAIFEPMMVGSANPSGLHGAITYESINKVIFLTASACTLYSSRSVRNIFLIRIISAPQRLKNATASKVLTPGLFIKLFVSTMIPEYRASASSVRKRTSSPEYCMISATISQADDANGSTYDNVGFLNASPVWR